MNGKWLFLGALALGGLVPQSLAAELAPVGPRSVAPDGSFEILWDYYADFNAYGLARVFASAGDGGQGAIVWRRFQESGRWKAKDVKDTKDDKDDKDKKQTAGIVAPCP